MSNYLYTFIIPHHNSPELLNRCLDTIPNRSDIQIIVVDDNSEANKKPQISRESVELVYIDEKQTKGAGKARNEGLARAQGEWLLFPDCDDCYSEGFLGILDKYTKHDIDVLYFNAAYRDGHTGELIKDVSFKKYIDSYDGSQIATDKVKYKNNVPWSKMVRREFVSNNNIKFEEVPNGNDILFSMMIAYYSTKIEVDSFVVYNYYKNPGSIISKKKTTPEMLCVLQHRMQQNYLFRFLGYPGWTISVNKFVYIYARQYGIPFIVAFINKFISLYSKRKDWVNMLLSSNTLSN